jgi:DNA gyrase subunit A
MKLRQGDALIGMGVVPAAKSDHAKSANLLVVMRNGYGKQTPVKEYRLQKRGGVGIKTAKLTDKTGKIVGALVVRGETELIAASVGGQTIRVALDSIRVLGRATQGVRIMKLEEGDALASIAVW